MIKEKIFRIIYDDSVVGKGVVASENIRLALKEGKCYYHPDVYEVQELNNKIKIGVKKWKMKQNGQKN